MDNITNEIVRSQLGGALLAGCGDAPNYLTELKENINIVREIASQYCTLTIKDKNTRVYFVAYFTRLLKKVNGMLPGYIEDLKQSQCIEAFSISTGQYRKEEFWQWCDWICSDMEGQKIYEYLKQNVDRLKALLLETEIATIQCKPELYEKFFFNEELQYTNDGVRKKFEKWMYDNMAPDIEKLRELQAQVVADALKQGVMDYAPAPSYREIEEVKVDYLKKLLPWNYDMSGDFTKSCARWRKFFHWEDTILVINYKKYGKYIQSHYYDFNDTQLQAIFELDMMLHLIHKEMLKLMEELRNEENNADLKSEEAMKYWRRLMDLGLVDSNCKLLPETTRQQAMYIVEPFAKVLGLKKQWKHFEDFWGIKNLAQEKWKFLQTAIMPPRFQDIDHVFED